MEIPFNGISFSLFVAQFIKKQNRWGALELLSKPYLKPKITGNGWIRTADLLVISPTSFNR